MSNSVVKSSKVLSELNGKVILLYECDFSQNDFFKKLYKTELLYLKSTDIFKIHPNLYKEVMEYTNEQEKTLSSFI
jgi:hypothetical protein